MEENRAERDTCRPSAAHDEAGSSAEDDRPTHAQPMGEMDEDTGGETGGDAGGEPAGAHRVELGGEARRKRRKTQPHPSSDIYVSEFLHGEKSNGRLATSMKDADAQQAKQEFYERLGRVLVLDTDSGDSHGDCVVLQSTQNEKIVEMSPFTTLMSYFTKPAQMREGKFRALIMAGTQRYVRISSCSRHQHHWRFPLTAFCSIPETENVGDPESTSNRCTSSRTSDTLPLTLSGHG